MNNVKTREVLTSLREWHFAEVPPHVVVDLKTAFNGFLQTAVNENCHNVLKDHLRDLKSDMQSRVQRHVLPVAEGVLKQFAREELDVNSDDRAGPRALPPRSFEPFGAEPSIADDDLRGIMSSSPTWPTYSPQSAHSIPAAMSFLLETHRRGTWAHVGKGWLAVAFQVGTFAQHIETGLYYLVLDANAWGVLLWPCSQYEVAGEVMIAPSTEKCASPSWRGVVDLDVWRVALAQACPPIMVKHQLGGDGADERVHLQKLGGFKSVLQAAASVAFEGVTDFFLDLFVQHLGIEPMAGEDPPSTMLQRVEVLVKHLLLGLSEVELAEVLALRVGAKPAQRTSQGMGIFSEDGVLQSLESVMDPSDKVDCQQKLNDALAAKCAEKKLFGFLQGRGYTIPQSLRHLGASLPTKSDETTREQVHLLRSNAKRFLPKAPGGGVILQPYIRECRYQIYYPTVAPPRSHSVKWSSAGGRTEGQALVQCLLWAWGHHTAQTGERCPFDFVS